VDLGSYHPIVVHFAIALLGIGVLFRLLSLTGRMKWAGPAAATLLIVGALTAVVAAESGDDAHEAAEHIPGVRSVVEEHQEWGERVRNLFIAVGVVELLALALRRRQHADKLLYLSAIVGLVGLGALYEAAEHGGELVYSYAGGVGMRTEDPADVERLLIAGLYQQAMHDRTAGDHEAAARLIDEMRRRRSEDPEVRMLYAQSLIEDRGDGFAALQELGSIPVSEGSRFLSFRIGLLTASAYELTGNPAAARDALLRLQQQFPDSRTVRERLEQLAGTPSEP